MNYRDDRVDEVIEELQDSGVVPLDEIYGLVSEGVDFSELDEKYNVNNQEIL